MTQRQGDRQATIKASGRQTLTPGECQMPPRGQSCRLPPPKHAPAKPLASRRPRRRGLLQGRARCGRALPSEASPSLLPPGQRSAPPPPRKGAWGCLGWGLWRAVSPRGWPCASGRARRPPPPPPPPRRRSSPQPRLRCRRDAPPSAHSVKHSTNENEPQNLTNCCATAQKFNSSRSIPVC
jgi:hypothetical protein